MSAEQTDYDRLLQANLSRVFNERDDGRRAEAIAELYAPEAVLYEPGHAAAGHVKIGEAVAALLAALPPDLAFTAMGPAVGHHGLARLRWRSGSPGGPVVVTGTDVARVEDGRIQTLHVFLDPSPRTQPEGVA